MKPFKEIIISKGKKAKLGPVHTKDVTIEDLYRCFFPKKGYEYDYLGYAYYWADSNGKPKDEHQKIIKEFLQQVDRIVKPWWCPRFFLHLLDLFGNDRSIVRVRNHKLSRLFRRITKGVLITDMKWKWETFRIYGYFTQELDDLAEETCEKLEKLNASK